MRVNFRAKDTNMKTCRLSCRGTGIVSFSFPTLFINAWVGTISFLKFLFFEAQVKGKHVKEHEDSKETLLQLPWADDKKVP